MKVGIKKMTLEEALKQGYRHFGIDEFAGEYQPIRDLTKLDVEEARKSYPNSALVLLEKESKIPSGISAEYLREIIEENMQDQYYDECGDDDFNKVADALKPIDFAPLAEQITAAMNRMTVYYEWSDIELDLGDPAQ